MARFGHAAMSAQWSLTGGKRTSPGKPISAAFDPERKSFHWRGGRDHVTEYIALNRYAVGSRLADREVARAREYETGLLSTAFSMSTLCTLIATTERTMPVSNVPEGGN
jgi:hypothetical protein